MRPLTLTQFDQYTVTRSTFALFGNPVGHSVSPILHRRFFDYSGYDGEYLSVEVSSEDLPLAFEIARKKLRGINLTIPHKIDVLPLLDEITEQVKVLGCVNTVLFDDGRAIGTNTDIDGFLLSFEIDQVSVKGRQAAVLGTGGAGMMAAYALAKNGAHVTVYSRKPKSPSAKHVAETLRKAKLSCDICDYRQIRPDTEILVNGTPVGMSPREGESPISLDGLDHLSYVFDCIYNPRRTALLHQAKERGILHRDGLLMLIGQGASAQQFWYGRMFDHSQLADINRHLAASLMKKRLSEKYRKQSLALCGFMASGKSSVAKRISTWLGEKTIDTDDLVEQNMGMTIAHIFETQGEKAFRAAEYDAVCEAVSKANGRIISLGGGAVLSPKNVKAIKETCMLVWIDTPIDRIIEILRDDKTRPLALEGEVALRKRFEERKTIYENCCDLHVQGNTIQELCRNLLRSV